MRTELADGFGRIHDYLRISLTDSCNLRCTYCMPEHAEFMRPSQKMTSKEVIQLAKVFVEDFGINKIRLTGGEPLIHPKAEGIIRELAQLPVTLALTTNGINLDHFLPLLSQSGIKSLNISLDTLIPEKFHRITFRNKFEQVWNNIQLARDQGFRIKLNMVVMRNLNEDEIGDFVALSAEPGMHVRFIEFMPFDGNQWKWEKVMAYSNIMAEISRQFAFEKLEDKPESTSKAYRVNGFKGTFAVISSVTDHFCAGCNRIRLTADGKLRNCLFGTREWDLLAALRQGQPIQPIIVEAILSKAKKLGGLPAFQDESALRQQLDSRSMVKIGG